MEWIKLRTLPSVRFRRIPGQGGGAGGPYRVTALGVIRVRDGEIVHYDDYMDPIAVARLLGRTGELAAALAST